MQARKSWALAPEDTLRIRRKHVCWRFRLPRKQRSLDLTQVSEWDEGKVRRKPDYLAAEEPLEIRIGEHPMSVTMRTPGDDLDLAAGFLVHRRPGAEAASKLFRSNMVPATRITASDRGNVVRRGACARMPCLTSEKMRRNFFAASSCGICGKASIDSVRARSMQPPNPDFRLDPEVLVTLPDVLRASQANLRTHGRPACGRAF